MNRQSFRLIPFGQTPTLDNTTILGTITRLSSSLSFSYTIMGNLKRIEWPPLSSQPERKDELWLHTCCESFVALSGQERYWEFNFAPTGDWNFYHFSTYRRRADETALPPSPTIRATIDDQQAILHVDVALPVEVRCTDPLQIGIATVVKDHAGQIEYFALTHPSAKPDFHLRSSFILEM